MSDDMNTGLFTAICRWYNGKTETTISPGETGPGYVIAPSFYSTTTYHWTARVVRQLVKFYLDHWQWLWATGIAVASLIAAILALK